MTAPERFAVSTLVGLVGLMYGSASVAQGPLESSAASSLRLRTERQWADRFREAEAAITDGRSVEATRWLEQLRTQALIPTTDGAVSGSLAAESLKRRLSREMADHFDAGREAMADVAWKKWQASPNVEGLQEFCRQFGDTQLGLQAWLKLGARYHDDRRWTFAAVAWEAAATHPRSTSANRARVLLALQETLPLTSNPDVARELAAIHRRLLSKEAKLPTAAPTAQKLSRTRPAPAPRWSVPLHVPESVREAWPGWLREMRSHGAWVLPSSRPLVLGEQIWLRTPSGLTAWHRETGDERSQIPLPEGPVFLELFGRRLAADSHFGRLSSDGRRIYLVHGPNGNNLPHFGVGAVSAANEAAKEPHNFLAAYDAATQEFLWRVGGPAAGPTYALADEFFCGAPLVVDDVLFVIGQQHSELQLLAIRADQGELLWKLALGDVPRALAVDPARQRIACTPVLSRGQLLCPTGAGAVIAVNSLTRSVTWVQRHGATVREAAARPRGENTSYLPDLWWEGWREAEIHTAASSAIVATPEAEFLYATELDTGRRVWSAPRQQGLCLLGTTSVGAVVLDPNAVRLHDLQTGAVVWRSEIGDVTGRGVLTDTHAVVPTVAGGVVRVSLRDGAVSPDDTGGSQLGNLWSIGNGWLSTGFEEIAAWSDLADERSRVIARSANEPPSPKLTLDLARLDLAAGQPESARQRLAHATDSASLDLHRRAWMAALRQSPQIWRQFLETKLQTELRGVDRVAAVLAIGRAAQTNGDSLTAAQLYLAALHECPREGTVEFANPRRQVRPDLALVAALEELLAEKSPGRMAAEQEFREAWRRAAASSDPFEIRKLSDVWSPLPIADELLQHAGRGPFLGQTLLGLELRLLKGMESHPGPVGTQLQRQLVDELRAAGFSIEANEYARARALMDSSATDPLPATTPLLAAWPPRAPEIEIEATKERNEGVYHFSVALDVESSPFFDRLDLSLDRQGRRVRFGGGGHSGTWEVPLPTSNSPIRYHQPSVAAWGRGRVLVLRVGSELFGLAPVDERGEPAAHVLWHLNTLEQSSLPADQLRQEMTPAIPGVRDEEQRLVDPYGHIVAQVGPVCAEFLCFSELGQLACIDLLTRQRRWTRFDVPPGTLHFGDNEFVLLWQPEAQRLTWLSAIDGATLGERDCDLVPESIIHQSGRLVWSLTSGRERSVICQDLVADAILWRLPMPRHAVARMFDAHSLGVVEPDGRMRILQPVTGQVRTETRLTNVPAEIERLVVARDAEQWYVAVSERVPQQAGLLQTQLRGGLRAPFVTGPLAAIYRETGQVICQTRLEREPFSYEQPKTSPVLLQVYKFPPADLQSGQLTDGVVKLIDKRTGATLLDHRRQSLAGYVAISADAPNGVVHLALEREIVHLWYRPRPPMPPLPEAP